MSIFAAEIALRKCCDLVVSPSIAVTIRDPDLAAAKQAKNKLLVESLNITDFPTQALILNL